VVFANVASTVCPTIRQNHSFVGTCLGTGKSKKR